MERNKESAYKAGMQLKAIVKLKVPHKYLLLRAVMKVMTLVAHPAGIRLKTWQYKKSMENVCDRE